MPLEKLKTFLDDHNIKYRIISHSPAYTAQEVAACAHIPGKDMAKTVLVNIDGEIAMVVVPASTKIRLGRLKKACGANEVCLSSENEFEHLFPDCELGAMPPFGNLYEMDVYVSDRLTEDEEIAFNAGSHTELMQLAYSSFEQLVQPRVITL